MSVIIQENKVTFKDGVYTLTLSFSGKIYGSSVAMAVQVKGDDPVIVLDRAKIVIKEMSEIGLKAVKSVEI